MDKRYEASLKRSMTEMQHSIDRLCDRLPSDTKRLIKSKAAARNVLRIMAIEEEWIVDPELRAELSALNYLIDGDI